MDLATLPLRNLLWLPLPSEIGPGIQANKWVGLSLPGEQRLPGRLCTTHTHSHQQGHTIEINPLQNLMVEWSIYVLGAEKSDGVSVTRDGMGMPGGPTDVVFAQCLLLNRSSLSIGGASQVVLAQESKVQTLDQESPGEGNRSSVLAWKAPWTEEPVRLVHGAANWGTEHSCNIHVMKEWWPLQESWSLSSTPSRTKTKATDVKGSLES